MSLALCVGRMDGELKVHCHDAATWRFPSFSGQLACRGLDFHFWDAVDDLSSTNIDLVFDDQRLYMHNASGMFGSIPLTLSGNACTAVHPPASTLFFFFLPGYFQGFFQGSPHELSSSSTHRITDPGWLTLPLYVSLITLYVYFVETMRFV